MFCHCHLRAGEEPVRRPDEQKVQKMTRNEDAEAETEAATAAAAATGKSKRNNINPLIDSRLVIFYFILLLFRLVSSSLRFRF